MRNCIIDIGVQYPEIAYRTTIDLDASNADGVFVSCTNFRTFEIIAQLKADLGKPVVTSNQATLWNALRTMGLSGFDSALGQLFDVIQRSHRLIVETRWTTPASNFFLRRSHEAALRRTSAMK